MELHTHTQSQRPGKKPLAYPQIFAFVSTLYHGLAGWCEVSTITGDPTAGAGGKFSRSWVRIDTSADLERLAARLGGLGERGVNVYVSSTLYSIRERSKAAAIPTRVLFVDDAPSKPELPNREPGLPYGMLVQTSPDSYHAYYFQDCVPDNDTRERQQAAIAIHLHADKSGADVTQIVRVPCTLNTKAKYGGAYPVALRWCNWQRLPSEQLESVYPVSVVVIQQKTPILSVELQLGNIDELIDAAGAPRRIKDAVIRSNFINAKTSERDSSTLLYTLAKSLVYHGYPDSEIGALLVHFAPAPHKPAQWLYDDIARVISKLRAVYTPYNGITATNKTHQGRNAPMPLPGDEKPAHRPQNITSDKLLAWYESQAESSVVQMTVHEVAQSLGVSKTRIERLERALRADELIRRNLYASNQKSCVELLVRPVRSTLNVPSEVPADATYKGTYTGEIISAGSAQTSTDDSTNSLLSTHSAPIQGKTAAPIVGGVCTSLTTANIESHLVSSARHAYYADQHRRQQATRPAVAPAATRTHQDADPLVNAALSIFAGSRVLGVLRNDDPRLVDTSTSASSSPAPTRHQASSASTRPAVAPGQQSSELLDCVEQWLESDVTVDYDTGVVYKNKTPRLCISHVKHMFGTKYSDQAIKNALTRARDLWVKYRSTVQSLTDDKLKAEYKKQLRLQTKHADAKLFKWYSVKVSILGNELQRRGLMITMTA